MFGKKPRYYLKKLLGISILWMVVLMIYFNVIFQTIETVAPDKSQLYQEFFNASLISVILGIFGAVIEILTDTRKIKRLPFILIVSLKTIFFIGALLITIFIMHLINPNPRVEVLTIWERAEAAFTDLARREMVFHSIYLVVFAFLINLFLQINRMMGKGVLRNIFLGRYHTPREQKRIIGFVDLSSSTSIAEKLSPQEYSSFIRDFFYDLDEAFEETRGAIFQYVGDEVVVIWNWEDGIVNNNCIRFFFLASDLIRQKEEYYNTRYGFIPQFKAGVHSGDVIIAEVGGSKTDIAYHGDTINTAARIRSRCSDLDRGLLISAELLTLLTDIDSNFNVESMGPINLKGKENIIALFSISRK